MGSAWGTIPENDPWFLHVCEHTSTNMCIWTQTHIHSHVHTHTYAHRYEYSNGVLTHAVIWMNSEYTMLSERSQIPPKITYYRIWFILNIYSRQTLLLNFKSLLYKRGPLSGGEICPYYSFKWVSMLNTWYSFCKYNLLNIYEQPFSICAVSSGLSCWEFSHSIPTLDSLNPS